MAVLGVLKNIDWFPSYIKIYFRYACYDRRHQGTVPDLAVDDFLDILVEGSKSCVSRFIV